MQAEVAGDAVKLAPTAAVTAISLCGIPLEQWVYLLTAVYTVLLIINHVWKNWISPVLDRRAIRKQWRK